MSIADDGLLLNFAAAGEGSTRLARRNGANKAKAQRRNQQVAPRTTDNTTRPLSTELERNAAGPSRASQQSYVAPVSTGPNPSRALKDSALPAQPKQSRPLEDGTRLNGSSSDSRRTYKASLQATPQGKERKGPSGVISSLFDRNGALESATAEEDSDHTPRAAPTNAPSVDSAFPPLGLDPLLCAHLASDKLKIKRPTSIQTNALPFLLHTAKGKRSAQRDALIHAQTGSGKTLSYLLPIVQSLLPLCETSWIDRSCLGTLAIVLAPTRELANQIFEVLTSLTNLSLTASHAEDDIESKQAHDSTSIRRTRWIVPGLLSGGATKNHEKSRLRKGLPIIVATPGRLLDHLRNTAALDVGRLQWLVLDEADRLLEMGFEQTLSDIMKAIDGRRRAACDAQRLRIRKELDNQVNEEALREENVIDTFGEAWWRNPRRTVLCSATLDEGVQVLAGKSLNNPRIIRDEGKAGTPEPQEEVSRHVAAPAQLVQNLVITPPKQRLVTLVALLRHAISKSRTAKIMVFLSCTDSVDFHLQVLAGVNMARGAGTAGQEHDGCVAVDMSKQQHSSQLLPAASLFRLHGSLTQQERSASLKQFIKSTQASILFCTSVASRGLDLDVSHVIQADAPTEKGADEYLHRIGRTARVGQKGESWLMLLPNEEACVAHYEAEMSDRKASDDVKASERLHRRDVGNILRDGFGGGKSDMHQIQTRATDAQMALERWTLARDGNAQLARRAYLSHLRAYATHPPNERHIFSIGQLQLGHLAKAFALREAPGDIRSKAQAAASREKKAGILKGGKTSSPASSKRKRDASGGARSTENLDLEVADPDRGAVSDSSSSEDDEGDRYRHASIKFQRNAETEERMYAKVRAMGSQHKRRGVLGAHGGTDEFQIA